VIDLPATPAGVVIMIGIAAVFAGVTGAAVKIAGNELGAGTWPRRILTGLLGLLLLAWSVWSLREKPFRITHVGSVRADILGVSNADSRRCDRELYIAASVRFDNGPGTFRYELRFAGYPPSVHTQKVTHNGSGSDLLGPVRIPAPHVREERTPLAGEIVVVAPQRVAENIESRALPVPPCARPSSPEN
jgi:hypothetical protein